MSTKRSIFQVTSAQSVMLRSNTRAHRVMLHHCLRFMCIYLVYETKTSALNWAGSSISK